MCVCMCLCVYMRVFYSDARASILLLVNRVLHSFIRSHAYIYNYKNNSDFEAFVSNLMISARFMRNVSAYIVMKITFQQRLILNYSR